MVLFELQRSYANCEETQHFCHKVLLFRENFMIHIFGKNFVKVTYFAKESAISFTSLSVDWNIKYFFREIDTIVPKIRVLSNFFVKYIPKLRFIGNGLEIVADS